VTLSVIDCKGRKPFFFHLLFFANVSQSQESHIRVMCAVLYNCCVTGVRRKNNATTLKNILKSFIIISRHEIKEVFLLYKMFVLCKKEE